MGLVPLDSELTAGGVEAEVLLVGGAVMSLVFHAEPRSRRVRDQFAAQRALDERVDRVADRAGLPTDWLSPAARSVIGLEGVSGRGWEGSNLRVYAPQPGYTLAMKCAQLGQATELEQHAIESDVRYLARLMGVTTSHVVIGIVRGYFTERQIPDDLLDRLAPLLK
jgi:hypothetical protein